MIKINLQSPMTLISINIHLFVNIKMFVLNNICCYFY